MMLLWGTSCYMVVPQATQPSALRKCGSGSNREPTLLMSFSPEHPAVASVEAGDGPFHCGFRAAGRPAPPI
jgi:hypothetical protein